jgi:hypothetical protein
MSDQKPKGPYVYQPKGIFEQPWADAGRLWAVSGLPNPLARIEGLTKEEAQLIVAALQRRQATEPARTARTVEAALTDEVLVSAVHTCEVIKNLAISRGGFTVTTEREALGAMRAVLVAALATVEPARTCATGWQPIESAPHNKIVLVHYTNALGNGRTVRARFYDPGTLQFEDDGSEDYCDENGYNIHGGWYEEAEAYENLMLVDGTPTHWMPLPPLPAETGASQET